MKACEADGIKFEVRDVDKMDLEGALHDANHGNGSPKDKRQTQCMHAGYMSSSTDSFAIPKDPNVHGILIYYPCFGAAPSFYGGSMDDYLRDSVPIEKDVEGLCHAHRHNLSQHKP